MLIYALVRYEISICLSQVCKSAGLDTVCSCLAHSPFLRVQNWF
jgi:hypothetical protein